MNHEIKSCKNKRWFPSRAAAKCKGYDVYQCRFCVGWHRTTDKSKPITKNRKHAHTSNRRRGF